MEKGTLYICGTPIGNLEDITMRQLNTFKLVDFIACEDTRHTLKLLNKYEISKKLISFHEHNYKFKGDEIIRLLEEGKNIALVSDAGMPVISDPGEGIVLKCRQAGLKVTTVPGPTALISGLILSGFSSYGFVFGGFFPKEKKGQKQEFEKLNKETKAVIYYEAPHRLKKTLLLLEDALGGERQVSVVREITKIHEEAISDTLCNLNKYYNAVEPKGEIVIVVEGIGEAVLKEEMQQAFTTMSIDEHMNIYLEKGMDKKEAMKQVAKERGVPKREIYDVLSGKNKDV